MLTSKGPTNFNPRSSCEERLIRYDTVPIHAQFQSTLLMRGATANSLTSGLNDLTFQSTLLMRGATWPINSAAMGNSDFNPRSSCEERLHFTHMSNLLCLFQSTLLMRGATRLLLLWIYQQKFQSTLLMRGATCFRYIDGDRAQQFQSTLLMRGATSCRQRLTAGLLFQSTLLMRGATR